MSRSASNMLRSFLRTYFEEKDEMGAIQRHAHPDFIQHNPEIDNGIAGYETYYKSRKTTDTVRVVNLILVEDQFFAIHHHSFDGPLDRGTVTVDIWRIADDLLAEHWDVIQRVPEEIRHGNTMWCGKGSDHAAAKSLGSTFSAPAGGHADRDADPRTTCETVDTYLLSVAGGDVKGAIQRWFSPAYVQHSPHIADGVQGAIDYLLEEFGKGDHRKPKAQLSHLMADGDLVLHHRHVVRPDGPPGGNVQADIFRVTDNRISEHWDVKQLVPAHSRNGNPMW